MSLCHYVNFHHFPYFIACDEVPNLFRGNLVELAGLVGLVLVGVEGDEADGDDEEELNGVDGE